MSPVPFSVGLELIAKESKVTPSVPLLVTTNCKIGTLAFPGIAVAATGGFAPPLTIETAGGEGVEVAVFVAVLVAVFVAVFVAVEVAVKVGVLVPVAVVV